MICIVTSIFFISKILPQQSHLTTSAEPVDQALAIQAEGIVVRKEFVYYAPVSGRFTTAQEEGQKVRRGAEMGLYVWDQQESLKEVESRYELTMSELSSYDNIRVDLQKIRGQIDGANQVFVDAYRRAIQRNDFQTVSESVQSYQTTYDGLFSEQNVLGIQLAKVQRTKRELGKMKDGEIQYQAPIAGIVSYVFDSYEEDFLFENVRNDLERAYRYIHDPFQGLSIEPEREWMQPIYRLSDNSAWYVLFRVPDDASPFFRESKQFVLTCEECLVPVRATQSFVSKTDDGEYWLLQVEERFYEINDIRHLNMTLRPSRIPKGVLLDRKAMRFQDGSWGVDRIRLNKDVVWTPVTIVDQNRENIIVQSIDENQLRAYDEVQLQEEESGQSNQTADS
jgi:hypothetical protein